MNQKYRSKCIFSWGSMACFTIAFAGHAQSLPEGLGKTDFQRICSGCHSTDVATTQRRTHAEWAGVVSDMVSRGAQGNSEELDSVLTYLSANFGKDKPPASNAAPSPVPAVERNKTPLSEAEVGEARDLLKANACSSCHRIDGTGSYIGPYLADIGAHRSAEQLRASLVSPNKEVLPENRTVQLVTRDGKMVTGRLLNQDGFSVELIDSSSQLRSFERSRLREFTIVTTNPMPSYANKMSAQELTDLVHYLSSLKGDSQP
jgi:putative heme-binding domain-containing protein